LRGGDLACGLVRVHVHVGVNCDCDCEFDYDCEDHVHAPDHDPYPDPFPSLSPHLAPTLDGGLGHDHDPVDVQNIPPTVAIGISTESALASVEPTYFFPFPPFSSPSPPESHSSL